MSDTLPEFYFRLRENGAAVFRIRNENRQRRTEFEEIAMVNIRNGNIKPHGEHQLSPSEEETIRAWLSERGKSSEAREISEALSLTEALNHIAHWAQSRASAEQLEAVTTGLLLAMHDLRSVLVRRKAEALMTAQKETE